MAEIILKFIYLFFNESCLSFLKEKIFLDGGIADFDFGEYVFFSPSFCMFFLVLVYILLVWLPGAV